MPPFAFEKMKHTRFVHAHFVYHPYHRDRMRWPRSCRRRRRTTLGYIQMIQLKWYWWFDQIFFTKRTTIEISKAIRWPNDLQNQNIKTQIVFWSISHFLHRFENLFLLLLNESVYICRLYHDSWSIFFVDMHKYICHYVLIRIFFVNCPVTLRMILKMWSMSQSCCPNICIDPWALNYF